MTVPLTLELLHFLLRVTLSYFGVVGAYMGFSLLWKLHHHGEAAMASFQLKPEQAIEDFKILLAMEMFMIIGFAFYTVGGMGENQIFLNIGRAYATVFSLFILVVAYRWWVRF